MIHLTFKTGGPREFRSQVEWGVGNIHMETGEEVWDVEQRVDPVGGLAVSINLDPGDLSNTGPPNTQHTPADMRSPTHIK